MTGLVTLADYEALVYSPADRFPAILRAAPVVIPGGRGVAEVSGDVEFGGGVRLGVREYLRSSPLCERLWWDTGREQCNPQVLWTLK
jgi:hypothetical protein